MERFLGIIKIFNIVAGVVLIVGVIVLAALLAARAGGPVERSGVTRIIELPPGYSVDALSGTDDRLALAIRGPDGRTTIIDIARDELGRLPQELVLDP